MELGFSSVTEHAGKPFLLLLTLGTLPGRWDSASVPSLEEEARWGGDNLGGKTSLSEGSPTAALP